MEFLDLVPPETVQEDIKAILIKGVEYKYVIKKMEKENGIIIEMSELKPNKNITFIYEAVIDKLTKDIKYLKMCDNIDEMIKSLNDIFDRGEITVEEKNNKYFMSIELSLLGKSKYEIELKRLDLKDEKALFLRMLEDIDKKYKEIQEDINNLKSNIKKELKQEIIEELNLKDIVKEILIDKEIKNMLFEEFEERLSNIYVKKEEKIDKNISIPKKVNESLDKIIDDKCSSKFSERQLNDNINKIKEKTAPFQNEINIIKNSVENQENKTKKTNNNENNTIKTSEDIKIKGKDKKNNLNKGLDDFIKSGSKKKQFGNEIEYKYQLLDNSPQRFSKEEYIENKKDIQFSIGIINTGKFSIPGNGRSKLIEINNQINATFIEEIKPGNSRDIIVAIPTNLVKLGKNIINLFLNIDGKNYGKEMTLTVILKSKNVEDFRREYNFNLFDDQKILSALQENKFNKARTFQSFFFD